MNKFAAAFLLLSLVVITGCVSPRAEFAPPTGALFTNYKVPLLINYDKTLVEDRKGSASSHYLRDALFTGLDLFSWDDCSIKQASQNGNVTKVGIADYEFFSILGIYAKTSVHVYSAP